MEMSSSINGEVREDVHKDWLIDIEEDLEPGMECCIYRVPTLIRNVNRAAYTPQVVAIGPLHYNKKELKVKEKLKERYVNEFFRRTTHVKREDVSAFIKKREQQIRNCYSETCDLKRDKYVEMILRDAIFIIEILLRDYNGHANDFLLSIQAERVALRVDLQLLENQLPYFLLEGLYRLVFRRPDFIVICCNFFRGGYQMFDSVPDRKDFKHFTDLQRAILVESYQKRKLQKLDDKYSDVALPCAAKLRESGVKFKRAREMEGLLDIRFDVPELKIPQLKVFDETEAIFRNIMALEQCHYPNDTVVCDYVDLLDTLIDTKNDIDLLIKGDIISNYVGDSTAIVSLFNKLCTRIALNEVHHYNNISVRLKAHYNSPWNKTKANLRSVYFSNVWRGTATIAAIIIVLLTIIQTICSIIQVV